MRLCVLPDFLHVRICIRLGQIGFLDVRGENGRLVGEQKEAARDRFFFRA